MAFIYQVFVLNVERFAYFHKLESASLIRASVGGMNLDQGLVVSFSKTSDYFRILENWFQNNQTIIK